MVSTPETSEAARRGSSSAFGLRIAFMETRAFGRVPPPRKGEVHSIGGLSGSSKTLLLAALREREERSFLLCCSDEIELDEWAEDLQLFSPERAGRPPPERLPELEREEDGSPVAGSLLARQALLESLPVRGILLCDLSALMAPVAPAGGGFARRLRLRVGEGRDPSGLLAACREAGMNRVPQVFLRGEVSHRGDVLDIFPVGGGAPIRLEFFDEEIESIRTFDPALQRSTESLEEVSILLPGKKGKGGGEALPHPLDLLDPAHTVVLVVEPVRFEEHFSRFTLREGSETEAVAAFKRGLARFPAYSLSTLPGGRGFDLGFESPSLSPVESGDLKGRIFAAGKLKDRPLVILRSEPEVQRLLRLARETLGPRDPGLDAMVGNLSRGFRIPELGQVILNHGEFFGTGIARPRLVGKAKRRKVSARAIESFFELQEGDLVVHAVHGIARFLRIERGPRGAAAGQEDHLRLQFAEHVEVLVPASKIDLVQKYLGSGQARPRLDRLGSRSFARRKSQVAQALRDMASELLDIQVKRARAPGFSCPAEDPLTGEFLASFPFEDTPDQETVTGEILRDLSSSRPMDRLLCGDVGFGKTEIAMRAAFQMVSAGKQVAVLVPTTLLADQHGRTFKDRMASFPVHIAVFSRLQTPKERKEILEALKKGRLDIVIGTHALLGKNVDFADLGLLIVDEEQRFGVAHKEKIRQLRANLEVLTLTATPIPRTLHMSLLGIKDISSLTTPPPGRLEISTKVCRRSSEIIRQSIRAELRRGGQVFFLHNRVFDQEVVRKELEDLVPEARIVIGHGQMPERTLLRNMGKFLSGEVDVFLSTTIVQSGLDIPRANTILVDGADNFGLSELHQLRGRVGRDITHAHCFLLYDPGKPMTPEARSRLKAIERFSGLGSGFSLAMKDLEIRGAGNLLGPEQSGHIAAIGYDMYCKLLQAAVDRVSSPDPDLGDLPEFVLSAQVDVDLGVDAYLPTDWIEDPDLRLGLLREMDRMEDEKTFEASKASLEDRFGRLPEEVLNLCSVFLVKNLLRFRGMSAARFLPPDQCVLHHPSGRSPHGPWLQYFADVRPVSPERTHLVLPPGVRDPEEVLAFLEDSLLGRPRPEKIGPARGGGRGGKKGGSRRRE